MSQAILSINQLRVQVKGSAGIVQPVDGVNLRLHRGEIFTLVGESGCGKTMSALAINRLLPSHAYLCQGSEILLDNLPLHALPENKMRAIRGKRIGMIFQDPSLALNPVLTIGDQLKEAFLHNTDLVGKKAINKQIIGLLEKVLIQEAGEFLNKYPHQLSGGMKQRVVIAMALAGSPDLLIADEPTTALDVTTQAQVLGLIKEIKKQYNMAILLITHDFGIVSQMADSVAVMYAGHIVEQASKPQFILHAAHPYSTQLFSALPEYTTPEQPLATIPGHVPALDKAFHLCRFKDRCAYVFKACEETPPEWLNAGNQQMVRCHWYDEKILKTLPTSLRLESLKDSAIFNKQECSQQEMTEDQQPIVLEVENLKVHFPVRRGIFKRTVGYVKAVDDLALTVREGQTLALVGESGSGKTTTGKAILRLLNEAKGNVEFLGENILRLPNRKLKKIRHQLQMIFQDPYSSMDPRMTINEILEEGMIALRVGSDDEERKDRIRVLLEQVGLPQTILSRFVHELSGGQRQRIAIARALAVGAQLIVCDEPTSALDLSVQAQILNLLKNLQRDLDISLLFITHNMGVVRYIADMVAVMYAGKIVEYGPMSEILQAPKHPYTQALLAAVPALHQENQFVANLNSKSSSQPNSTTGCQYAPHCPKATQRCLENYPETFHFNKQHRINCYLYTRAVYQEKVR